MSKTIRLATMVLCLYSLAWGQRTVESTTITIPPGSPPTSTPSRNKLPKVDEVRGTPNGGSIRVVDSSITDANGQVSVAGDLGVTGNSAGALGKIAAKGDISGKNMSASGDIKATGQVQSGSVSTDIFSANAGATGIFSTTTLSAGTVNVTGNLAVGGSVSGNFSGNGAGLLNVNANTLGGYTPDAFLLRTGGTLSGGISGTTASFVGSTKTLSVTATGVEGTGISVQADGDGGVAIFGHAIDTTPGGHTIGVFGQTDGPEGNGVYGLATCIENCSRENAGVRGEIRGDHGRAVFGFANSTTGNSRGVVGRSDAEDGIGVLGTSQPHLVGGGGNPTGVFGQTLNDFGFGVVGASFGPGGIAGGGTGVNGFVGRGVAIWGQASTGIAGLFETSATACGRADDPPSLGICTPLVVRSPAGQVFSVKGDGSVHGSGFFVGGADFAESLRITGDRAQYEAGDVLVIDVNSDTRLAKTQTPYSTLAAGIVSTKPGVLASAYNSADGEHDRMLDNEVPLAVIGIVPCKVTTENGPINRGDLLVTSSTPGYAMKGTERSKLAGAIVGKALEPLAKGTGKISVLVTVR